MRNIFNLPSVRLVSTDGSPSGLKQFLLWNTPYKSPHDPSSGRGDSIQEAAKLFSQLILRGVRAISFCRVRNACELMLQAVRTELGHLHRGDVGERIMGYRGGYTSQDRRRIEKEMFSGHLLGVVATNALELGVDIGSLDAVVIVNFPHSISNLRQQSGRAGRRNKDSLSVLVGGGYPVDQYYMNHPEDIFNKPDKRLVVDIDNPLVLLPHLQCAAHELPLHVERDIQYFGPSLPDLVQQLVRDDTGFYHPSSSFLPYPAKLVPIRDVEDAGYAVINTTSSSPSVLETLEPTRAVFSLYEGGIFLHQGRTFLIRTVNHEGKFAAVEAVNVAYTTSPRDYTDITPMCTHLSAPLPGEASTCCWGEVNVETHIFGYFKLDSRKRILDAVEMDSPSVVRETKGCWIDIPADILTIMMRARMNVAAGIHAASHAILEFLQMEGLRTECKAPEKEFAKHQTKRKRPGRLVFYETKETGVARVVWMDLGETLERARERVEECDCEMGCVECCLGNCSEGNLVCSKRGAVVVLRGVLGMEIGEELLSGEEEKGWDNATVVPAGFVRGKVDHRNKVKEEEQIEEGDGYRVLDVEEVCTMEIGCGVKVKEEEII